MKERIIIVGGGFAGLSALHKFKGYSEEFEIILIDKKRCNEFLPLLPDIIGNNFPPDILRTSLEEECAQISATFAEEEVIEIQREQSRVITTSGQYTYSYLIIAAGSVTNFYDHYDLKPLCHEFKSATHASILRDKALSSDSNNIVICGGGYTGIEVATAIHRALRLVGMQKKIIIANINDRVCPMFESKISEHIRQQLIKCGIEVQLNNTVTDYINTSTKLQNGEIYRDSLLVWVSGVKVHSVFSDLNLNDPQRQGRLAVNEHLQLSERIYVAGDCAAFSHNGQVLRMSVQNALTQGACAAENIIRSARGKPLKPFKPFDPGYVLPIYSGSSCGKIMGVPLYGRIPLLLHYFMCTIKSCNWQNRFSVLKHCLSRH